MIENENKIRWSILAILFAVAMTVYVVALAPDMGAGIIFAWMIAAAKVADSVQAIRNDLLRKKEVENRMKEFNNKIFHW